MKPPFVYIILVLFIAQSCKPETVPGQEKRFQNKSFVYSFYDSEEECLDSQPPDFFINCHQQVDFYKYNQVEIMLSDIIWRGEYHVENNTMILTFEPNFEIPDGIIVFEIKSNSVLKHVSNGTKWKKMNGNSIWK